MSLTLALSIHSSFARLPCLSPWRSQFTPPLRALTHPGALPLSLASIPLLSSPGAPGPLAAPSLLSSESSGSHHTTPTWQSLLALPAASTTATAAAATATPPFRLASSLPPVPAKLVRRIQALEFVEMRELLPDNMALAERQKQTTPWTNVPWPLWCRRCAQASGNHGPQGPAKRSDHSLRINPPHPQNGSASPGTGGCAHFQERARLSTLTHCATALTTRPGTAPAPPPPDSFYRLPQRRVVPQQTQEERLMYTGQDGPRLTSTDPEFSPFQSVRAPFQSVVGPF